MYQPYLKLWFFYNSYLNFKTQANSNYFWICMRPWLQLRRNWNDVQVVVILEHVLIRVVGLYAQTPAQYELFYVEQ